MRAVEPCSTREECMEVAKRVAIFVETKEYGGGDVKGGVVQDFLYLNKGDMYMRGH